MTTIPWAFFDGAIGSGETIFANTLAIRIADSWRQTSSSGTTSNRVDRIETLAFDTLLVVNRQVTGSCLNHPIFRVFRAEHAEQLTLLIIPDQIRQTVVNVNSIFSTRDIERIVVLNLELNEVVGKCCAATLRTDDPQTFACFGSEAKMVFVRLIRSNALQTDLLEHTA